MDLKNVYFSFYFPFLFYCEYIESTSPSLSKVDVISNSQKNIELLFLVTFVRYPTLHAYELKDAIDYNMKLHEGALNHVLCQTFISL